ncbi:nucleotidyltransferase domain-containing protein [Microbacterium sp. M3]|uniref:Nucleotidyltransferase domain-containing protein n=1 Tax=Microbacterium arthrosphaerae TaxID=792652 RepID=A0ABU4H5Y4_9MICO|nr:MULTISPECIES: nucleotidyltransferase domain-containing protein [Microbacterium]MDW4574079.1 nucleotidyltransferase domain-containing protein [Microbacterium arthrosphaerae]MDW7607934.1 nucleotidyltransferase domain-containing protein [Microbacterium sp. M3]
MFSATDRAAIQSRLIARAVADQRVIGAALVGSAARGSQDDWSDIDLALQLNDGVDEQQLVDEWSQTIDDEHGLSDTHDVWAAGARYRVFLLSNSLQVDVSFWPHDKFRATEPGFHVLFGTPNEPTEPTPADASVMIGMGWLYALHARSSIARGKLWQATSMLEGLRSQVLALMCGRVGLNAWHGREIDRLPADDLAGLEATLIGRLVADDLDRARIALTRLLLDAVTKTDSDRARRLQPAFDTLVVPVS